MKFYRLILLTALAILITSSSAGCSPKKADRNSSARTSSEKDNTAPLTEQVQTFSIYGFSENGKKKWEVKGKSADILSETINLTDINANSYGEGTKVNLKADKGVFDRRQNDIELKDNVVAVTDDGTRLTTEKLKWNAKDERIDTDEHVRIERKEVEVEGQGASAEPNLKKARLKEDIKVNIKPATMITCDGPLEINYNENVSYFNNNVKLVDGSNEIFADKATAYFDPKQRLITKVLCEGNVKIIRGENATYTDTLTYLPGEGRAILTGRPKVIINSTDELLKEAQK